LLARVGDRPKGDQSLKSLGGGSTRRRTREEEVGGRRGREREREGWMEEMVIGQREIRVLRV
jgi:hypothetical protein